MKHRRPFRIERTDRGVGDGYANVWSADGKLVATGGVEMCERRMAGWNGLVEPTMDRLLADIDDMTSPTNMSLTEAKEFLERLQSEIEVRIDGIRDSLRNELAVAAGGE